MSETAREIIYDALRMIFVTGDEERVEPSDATRGLRTLNRMMAAFESEGIDLGYVAVDALTDDVDIDAGAYEGVIVNLALRLWPYFYKTDPSSMIVANAMKGKKDLVRISVAATVEAAEFPDTLPLGSGNEGWDGSGSTTFFTLEDE